jgi:hypothetical protein
MTNPDRVYIDFKSPYAFIRYLLGDTNPEIVSNRMAGVGTLS